MNKKQRVDDILSLIEEFEIDTQEELTEKLNERGYNVSQATVSRDINELSLIKTNGVQKKFKYSKPIINSDNIPDNLITIFKNVCINITNVNNLIVIKTLTGNAGSAGMAVDSMHIEGILGTIAGDDTLLVITKSQKTAENIFKNFKSL